MRNRYGKALLAAAVALLALPASAAAASWVSTAPPSAPFNSCAHPRYQHIQTAVEAGASMVKLCAGTYEEQVQITKSVHIVGEGSAIVKVPASPSKSTTSCDTKVEEATPGAGVVEDGISICGAIAVQMTGVTVDAAWPEGTCNDNLYGINVSGGAELKLSSSSITAAGAVPLNGCQGGIGVQVGAHFTTPEEGGSVKLKEVAISGYQKEGINLDGKSVDGLISNVTVKGIGSTSATAQNGIQVGFGATAVIRSSSVSENEYAPTSTAATGIILVGAGAGTKITKTKVINNGYGIYYEDEEATAPSSPQVSIRDDEIEGSQYISVLLIQGSATVESTLMKGGENGIALDQFTGQPYGFKGTGTKDTIEGMSSHAVQGYSDNEAGDPPSEFTITRSKISGNPPGANVAESVFSESPTVKINYVHDS